MLSEGGSKTAKLLEKYKKDIDRPVAAILSLNTVAHTIGAAGVGSESSKIFGDEYFAVISAILTLLILVLSEIIPKTVGARYWRTLALPATKVISVLIFVTYPLVLLSELITKVFSSKKDQVSVSREEVSAMVSVGAKEGVFEAKENKMIQNFIRVVSVKASDIMTPNLVVESAPESTVLRDFDDDALTFSRIPVYKEDKDYITGYILRDEVLEKIAEDKFDVRLSDIMRPILSFHEDTTVSDIWENMIEKKEHISIIVDEYGCMRGIVTMEDVIETMLGVEIVDEHDDVVDMQKLALERWKKMKSQRKSL
jgi:CBS domain containing-hemolysin-like protein